MRCCTHCFVSPTLKDYIENEGKVGCCDFCSNKNVKSLNVSDLHELFEPMLGLYREIEYGKDYFEGDAIDHGELLPRLIEDDWSPMFSDDFDEDMLDDFWNSLVEQEHFDKDYPATDLSRLYVMAEGFFEDAWDYFSDYLRTNRRFTRNKDDIFIFMG